MGLPMSDLLLNPSEPLGPGLALRRVARIALLPVVLGFAMQGLILAATLSGPSSGSAFVVSLAGGITWSVLVCAGLGLATAIAKARPLLSGLFALLVAPLALACAKGMQKAMGGWLNAVKTEAVLPLATVSALRALEYGLLGWLLGRLVQADQAQPWPYLRAGIVAGLTFGTTITLLTLRAADVSGDRFAPPLLMTTLCNEVVFPLGCALVIYLGQDVGRHLKLAEGQPG
jgi:hypothetical protein